MTLKCIIELELCPSTFLAVLPETRVCEALICDKIIGYLNTNYLFVRDTYTCIAHRMCKQIKPQTYWLIK